jgi:hypothetical protein
MSRPASLSQGLYGQVNRAMTAEQFDQVVTAIVDGKYSWACVLILRYAGYNPAHYLPYRTYKRLIKENRPSPLGEAQPSWTAEPLRQVEAPLCLSRSR